MANEDGSEDQARQWGQLQVRIGTPVCDGSEQPPGSQEEAGLCRGSTCPLLACLPWNTVPVLSMPPFCVVSNEPQNR